MLNAVFGKIVISFNSLMLLSCRGMLILAASIWQHVLPPRSSAKLYDPTDDGWMAES